MQFRNYDKGHYDALWGVEAFPFDRGLDQRYISNAEGLDKLCYVADRALAKVLYDMFWTLKPAPALDQKREAERRKEEIEWLNAVATSSLNGAFGSLVRDKAREFLCDKECNISDDEATLRTWLVKVKNMDWRSHADATKRITR